MAQFDELIHQPVRLRLMAALMTLDEKTRISFNMLKEVLQVTDGNLSVHLSRLEEAGYVLVEKTFVNKKPFTYIAVTPYGRSAFSEHIEALQKLLQISLPVVQEKPGQMSLDSGGQHLLEENQRGESTPPWKEASGLP